MTNDLTPAQQASDYFNSLPFEQRHKLAPLLEDYRRMGIEEALNDIDSLRNGWRRRVCDIEKGRTLPRRPTR